MSRPPLPSGLVVFVKRDCPTCELVAPVLADIARRTDLVVFSQDDPAFPPDVEVRDDRELEASYHHEIEAVPTLVRVEDGAEVERVLGWHRDDWTRVTGLDGLGTELPDWKPGCGSRSVDPIEGLRLRARMEGGRLLSRRVAVESFEDEMETAYARGWSDGLPVVPPTVERVIAMLDGTTRAPDEVVATVAPDLVDVTVEKVAVNAVMAGCKPEYLPVVLAAVEAACTDAFNIHGVLATTMPAGPVIVVNGPVARRIGMNSGVNVFGQGNRANSTIGRALQLVVRNVGGGRPGGVDRATHGNPGKLGLCFAEDEEGSPWGSLAEARGLDGATDAVTLFAGEGPRCIVDQLARDPESLAATYAANLRTLHHPKLVMAFDCMLAIGPEHARVFREAGWSRERLTTELQERLSIPAAELVRGAGGMAEGVPAAFEGHDLPKFRPGGLLLVHCGGGAGLFSAMIGGWVSGEIGSEPVTKEVRP